VGRILLFRWPWAIGMPPEAYDEGCSLSSAWYKISIEKSIDPLCTSQFANARNLNLIIVSKDKELNT
jgi:hypothetical protein